MMKVFLSVLGSDSEKTIDIPSGKTTLGRGPFLGCSDKKVSRNHAVLEVQSNGDIFLTPTHVNPCFYRTTSETTLRIIKKDIPQRLQPGDVFSLLPNSFQYEVHQKSPDGKVLPLPSETLNKGKSGAPNSSNEDPLNTKSESNHSKKLTENGDSADKTNMQTKSAAPKTEAGKKEEIVKNSENESKKSELTKSSLPKSSTSEKSSLQKSSETPNVANNQISNSCGAKSPKASQLSCPRRRTLPDWLVQSASTAAKAAKSSKNGHSIANNAKDDKKVVTNAKIAKIPPTTVSNNNRVNNTGRSYTGRQNRQTIQKISLDDFEVSDDEEVQWKSPDESDDSSQRSKSRRGGRWHGRGGKRDSDSGSDWEMENRKSKKNWRSNEASSGSDWETTRTTSSQRKRRGRPQRKSYNSDSGSDWEMGGSKRRSIRKKAAPVTRRPRRTAKRKASEDDDVDEDEDVRNESEDDRKKARKRKSRKDEKEEEEEDVEDEKSTKSSPARSEGGRKREPCLYAKKCYRKNASHFDVYSHPGDSDYTSPKEEEDDEDDEEDEAEKKTGSEKKESKKESPQKECPYGIDCFRKNPQHKKEFKHTKKVRPTREASKKSSKYNEEEEEEDISLEESDEYDPAKEIAD